MKELARKYPPVQWVSARGSSDLFKF